MRKALALALVALGFGACAGRAFTPPPAGVPEKASAVVSYSADLRVSLKSPEFRARTRAIVAFRRPDALRLEVPGPAGPRLVAVTREGRLAAVFPGERAFFEGEATQASFAALLGVPLEPAEVMDLLLGVGSPRLKAYRAGWGSALPDVVAATLPDGGRLDLTIEAPEAGVTLRDTAFEPPPHEGYRKIAAAEARSLWSGR